MNDHDYAISVGISLYPSGFKALMTAPKDATRFMEWIGSEDGGGVPESNRRLIITQIELAQDKPIDPLDWKPEQDDIDQALRCFGVRHEWQKKWKGRNGKKYLGRRLYFYFAGHGLGHTQENVGMLMADASRDSLLSKSASLQGYRDFFNERALFEELVFIVDCCRDPVPSGVNKDNTPRGPSIDLPRDRSRPPVTELVVLAAAYGHKAYEVVDPDTHESIGVLTRILLKAIRDRCAIDEQGRITPDSVKRFIASNLNELAGRAGNRKTTQSPELLGNTITVVPPPELVLGSVVADAVADVVAEALPAVPVRIVAPAGLSGELVVFENGRTEIARRAAKEMKKSSPPWRVDLLPSQRYVVQHTTEQGAPTAAVIIDWQKLEENDHVFVYPGGRASN